MSDSLPNIVEDYILEKRNEGSVNRDIYSDRLRALGLRDEEIHNIIIEIDDDCDKELLAGKGIKKSEKRPSNEPLYCYWFCYNFISYCTWIFIAWKNSSFLFRNNWSISNLCYKII